MSPMLRYCRMDDCLRPAFRGDLCSSHLKRQQRGKKGPELCAPIATPLSPYERFDEACYAWLEADSDDDAGEMRLKQARDRAAENWLRSRGWGPSTEHGAAARMRGPRRAERKREAPQLTLF